MTPRELEIVCAVVAGLANKEIAQHFNISEDGVKRHFCNIFDKLGVSTRLELDPWDRRLAWIELLKGADKYGVGFKIIAEEKQGWKAG